MSRLGYRRAGLLGAALAFFVLSLVVKSSRAVWIGLAVVFFVMGLRRARS